MCSFSSNSVDVLKLHALSHQSEAAKILEELPQSLKEVCFGTKEQFKTDLNEFLDKLGFKAQSDEFILRCLLIIVECPECGKTMTKKNLKRHIKRAHLKKEQKEKICLLMETAHLKKEEREQILGQCQDCGKNLRRDSIKRHMRTVHKETKECEDRTEIQEFLSESLLSIVECPECGKSMTKKNLRRHKETAHLKKEEKEQIGQCK